MTENFQTMIDNLEEEIKENQFAPPNDEEIKLLNNTLELLIKEAKLETAKQLKELVEKAIKEYESKVFCECSSDEEGVYQCNNCSKIEELRKSLGVEE